MLVNADRDGKITAKDTTDAKHDGESDSHHAEDPSLGVCDVEHERDDHHTDAGGHPSRHRWHTNHKKAL